MFFSEVILSLGFHVPRHIVFVTKMKIVSKNIDIKSPESDARDRICSRSRIENSFFESRDRESRN